MEGLETSLEKQLEIVSEINDYFAKIGENLAHEIPPSNIELNYDNRPQIPFLQLQHTTPEEVTKILNTISDSKATGEDGVPIRFI